MGAPVALRLARLDDADAIRQIYNAEVSTSTVTFDIVPRTLDEQRAYLSERSGAHAVIVANRGGQVVGFGALSPWRTKPAYATSVEDSVYVHREHQSGGIGRTLLGELVRVATAHGFHAVFGRIVGGHEASIRLHEALGFEVVGVEREVGRKFGRWLDVVIMQRLLNPEVPTETRPAHRRDRGDGEPTRPDGGWT
jgi:L-amino acid N-acyltransferase